jgi:hypothetical protein
VWCGLLCLTVAASAADTSTKSSASASPSTPVSVKHSKHKSSTGKHSSSGKHARGKTTGKRKRGQAAIDSPRAQQIQEALIRQHYMDGEPSGTWDVATQDAMRRYQADQGWQAKTVPDSRALIKLGLGPSKDGLLNPESAMTTGPLASSANAETKQRTAPANPSAGPANDAPPPQ